MEFNTMEEIRRLLRGGESMKLEWEDIEYAVNELTKQIDIKKFDNIFVF